MTVRRARLPLALTVEALWSFAAAAVFVRAVSGGDGPAPSFGAIVAIVLASFAVARWLPATRLAEAQARATGVALSVLALAVILHLEYAAADWPWHTGWAGELATHPYRALDGHRYVLAGAIALTLLWLRGLARWSAPFEAGDALASASIGFAAVALAAAVGPSARGPHPFGVVALAMFVAAFCLLELYQTADADEPLARFAARWSAGLAVVIGVAAGFALLVAAVDPSTLGFLRPAGSAAGRVLELILAYTLGLVIGGIAFLFGLIPHHAPPRQMLQPPAPAARNPHGGTPFWFEVVGWVAAGAGVTVVALAFIAVIWFALRRYARRKPATGDERRSVDRDNALGEDLQALLDGLARRFRRAGAARSQVEIRRLYHHMMQRAAADGLARPSATTPSRFAPAMDAHFGSGVPSEITAAFVMSRYGLVSIDAASVRELRARWDGLQRST